MDHPRFIHRMNRFLAGALFTLFSAASFAEAPPAQLQVPGYYRVALGDFQITALYDGPSNLDVTLFKNAPVRKIEEQLARFFLEGPTLQTAVNAFLVNTGGKLILIDTGAAKLLGPNLGHIVDNLKAAGHTPDQVDVVLLTHLHVDHINGLVTPDGQRVFVNADIWSSGRDNDFWLDENIAAMAPDGAKSFFRMARAAAAPYIESGQWKVFVGEQEIQRGIHAMDTFGHTPGHTSYRLESQGEKLLILGDLVHNYAIQFSHPEVSIDFDSDPKKAIASRKRIFAKAAKEKLLVAGMHLPFPGIGHIRRDGKAYTWVPIVFSPLSRELK
ncbi:MAG: MBL fold metallo-hydrolase [Candidatus Accumulibacter sp.]|jgi:glyoxylase-like metal-dependent hydrolase (beta-lactamase superfamily II)|nr:MBL fold metallo-hydrolase [Accumulibacter sp.]